MRTGKRGGLMTPREEAERLLSSVPDSQLVEIDDEGKLYAPGTAPVVQQGKPIAGISDQRGEYLDAPSWPSR